MITILQEKRGEIECFVLSDGKNSLAECIYSFENAEILTLDLFPGEDEMFREDVLRAALSRLDFAGKTTVKTKLTELGDFLTKLGFTEDNGVYLIETGAFFKPCCSEKH
ncbi:MAG: hypothetical protein J6D42_08640 [Clostridia bacterium]|nr:hypothetical protein [Clostridia bacterium]